MKHERLISRDDPAHPPGAPEPETGVLNDLAWVAGAITFALFLVTLPLLG